jgi:hypothetical protein
MQVVSGVEFWQQAIRTSRIAHDLVEVNYRIKMARHTNPFVDSLTVRFTLGLRMIKAGAGERQNCSASNLDSVSMSASDNLLICSDDVPYQFFVLGGRGIGCSAQHSDVIDSLEDDQVSST